MNGRSRNDGTPPETVAFHFTRPKAGAEPDANGIMPTEEVTINVPVATLVHTPPPMDLVRFPDGAVLRLYQLSLALPDDTESKILLAEMERRGLKP